jgi:hypothetical protein
MAKNQKLELQWIGKDQRPRLEPRIFLEDPELSYHAAHRVGPVDLFDNRLIFGDNLLALKALEQEFTGKIKCIYIDPPYNTGSAFEHYDDGIEHSLWLSLMRDRLELLRRLLSDDGSIWITLDDNEAASRQRSSTTFISTSSTSRRSTLRYAAATSRRSSGSRSTSERATSNISRDFPISCSSWTNRTATARRPASAC